MRLRAGLEYYLPLRVVLYSSFFLFFLAGFLTMTFPEMPELRYAAIALAALGALGGMTCALSAALSLNPARRDRVKRHSTHVRFMDATGEKTRVTIHRVFSTRARELRSYRWQFGSDNGLKIEDVDVDPGFVQDHYERAGLEYVIQDFGRELHPGDLIDARFDGLFLNAYLDPNSDYWTTSISHPTRELEISLTFHKDRRPDPNSFVLIQRVAHSEYALSADLVTIDELDDEVHVRVSVLYPAQFSAYRLVWSWKNQSENETAPTTSESTLRS